MITQQPTNNQHSVHKNHLKQTGLATQGRGLDNEDLPCFEGKELFRLCVATRSKFRQSTSFANRSNALNLLLRAGDACGEEPNAGLRHRTHQLDSKWQGNLCPNFKTFGTSVCLVNLTVQLRHAAVIPHKNGTAAARTKSAGRRAISGGQAWDCWNTLGRME